jgi:predicted dienelactone hydrolase
MDRSPWGKWWGFAGSSGGKTMVTWSTKEQSENIIDAGRFPPLLRDRPRNKFRIWAERVERPTGGRPKHVERPLADWGMFHTNSNRGTRKGRILRSAILAGVTLLFGPLAAPAPAAAPWEDAASQEMHPLGAPYPVATATYCWFDAQRQRQVPAKIYYPSGGVEPIPVIIFSHGLGRSREDCEYLGRCWAGHGYVSVHVQHLGSDEAVWQGKLRPMKALHEAFEDSGNSYHRLHDVSFAIDQLQQMRSQGGSFGRRLDLERLGAAGQDFGAQTVLAIAGQALPRRISLVDSRVKAVVAMSPPVPLGQVPLSTAYGGIRVPCLHITGTADDSVVGTTPAPLRRLPFDYIHGADQFLVTFTGGDHMIYSGHKLPWPYGQKDALFQRLICISSTAFWDAYLKGDAGAWAWLTAGGLDGALGPAGRLEKKLDAGPVIPAQ